MPQAASTNGRSTHVSIVIPTRNESPNIVPLLDRITAAVGDLDVEVIFVDDSSDDSPQQIRVAGSRAPFRVSTIHRPEGNRPGGLSGAVVSGIEAATGTWVCVMDGDLQHPPELIPGLYECATSTEVDLAVGTRYADPESRGGLSPFRSVASKTASQLAKRSFPTVLETVTDPMSGFFMVRRDALDLSTLEPNGFKILMEIVVRHPHLSVGEVPFDFAPRAAGQPKASPAVAGQYVRQLRALRKAGRDHPPYTYDIHGIIGIETEVPLPELGSFEVRRLHRAANLRIRVGKLGETSGRGIRYHREHITYREMFGWSGFAIDVHRVGEVIEIGCSRLLERSPHVLYTNVVEPILRWRFVELGYALVHTACVDADGRAFAITARTDTGKTTTMLKVLAASDMEFVSDDMTLITGTGHVITYPKPLTISAHTLHAVTKNRLSGVQRIGLQLQSRLHSKSGRQAGFLLTKLPLPIASMNAVVQRAIPPPKFRVQELVPGVREATGASLAGLFIIQRGGSGERVLEPQEAVEILLDNCEDAYGFPPYSDLEPFLRQHGGDLKVAEEEIIRKAFSRVPAILLHSDRLDWAERIPPLIDAITGDAESAGPDNTATAIDLRNGADVTHESVPTT